jgi:hypothetical protein
MQYNVFGSKHRSNVQGNEENCWSQKQTRKQRRISGFCQSIFFFGIKNVRIGSKILGSIGNTYFFLALCDKVCQWLATGWWFSLGTPISSTNKTDCHDITEILLKVALNTIKQTKSFYISNRTLHAKFLPYGDSHFSLKR